MATVNETLEERGNVYGEYSEALDCKNSIMDALRLRHKQTNKEPMSLEHEMMFQDVIGKLSRLGSSPTHLDSWHDLAGYSLLVERTLKGKTNESK